MVTGSSMESDAVAAPGPDPICATELLRAVEEIVNSRFFRTSPQCQKLLRYVVAHTLDGKGEELKERVIGYEVFGRPADYNTAEDPVVRTRAADVRKRLAIYYQNEGAQSPIRISIPSGSYHTSVKPNSDSALAEPVAEPSTQHFKAGTAPDEEVRPRHKTFRQILVISSVFVLVVAFGIVISRADRDRNDHFATFWAPVAAGPRPPIIYVGSSAIYRLKQPFIEQYRLSHPAFKPQQNGREFTVPLAAQDFIKPTDLLPDDKSFVTVGDVAAAVSITSMLAERKQPYDLRIGEDVVFGDFRAAPVILIGAFNNSWTIELSNDQCFAFGADNTIRETKGQRRVWRTVRDAQGVPHEDYALISREISPKSEEFVFTVAGLDLTGTRAAAEFVRDRSSLNAALQNLPLGWQNRNLQLVLHANVLDQIPSGSQVVASCLQ
jgi:hypothetical protein